MHNWRTDCLDASQQVDAGDASCGRSGRAVLLSHAKNPNIYFIRNQFIGERVWCHWEDAKIRLKHETLPSPWFFYSERLFLILILLSPNFPAAGMACIWNEDERIFSALLHPTTNCGGTTYIRLNFRAPIYGPDAHQQMSGIFTLLMCWCYIKHFVPPKETKNHPKYRSKIKPCLQTLYSWE